MKEQHYQARRDEHMGMEKHPAQAHHGHIKEHLAKEHSMHKEHLEHARKMHHMSHKGE